jgi:hypothetical protein
MLLASNTCYRIIYEDHSSITFRIEGDIPMAIHKILVRDLYTGKEKYLFDLLMAEWIDFAKVDPVK